MVTAGRVLDQHGVRVDEAAVAGVELDVIADQLRADHILLPVNDMLCPGH